MKELTLDAITIGPIENRQSGFYALNLTTGQRIKRYSTTPLPTPQSVIDKVTQFSNLRMYLKALFLTIAQMRCS